MLTGVSRLAVMLALHRRRKTRTSISKRTLRDIHTELADLNKRSLGLAAKIQDNFEELAG